MSRVVGGRGLISKSNMRQRDGIGSGVLVEVAVGEDKGVPHSWG